MSQLVLKGLTYSYADGISALKDISLSFENGERVALVGPNGAGKTTLLLAASGLITFQGDVLIDGQGLTPKNKHELRRNMSFVFQNPDEMLFMPTVIEDVCFGLVSLGLQSNEALERGREALAAVSLSGFDTRSAHQLSYGERRRVTLASAYARRSTLTFFDEPTRELDPRGRRNFMELFHTLPGTLILATHDLELVLETCPRMILLDGGVFVAQGYPRKLLADKALMEAHRLEVPHSLIRHPHAHDGLLRL